MEQWNYDDTVFLVRVLLSLVGISVFGFSAYASTKYTLMPLWKASGRPSWTLILRMMTKISLILFFIGDLLWGIRWFFFTPHGVTEILHYQVAVSVCIILSYLLMTITHPEKWKGM